MRCIIKKKICNGWCCLLILLTLAVIAVFQIRSIHMSGYRLTIPVLGSYDSVAGRDQRPVGLFDGGSGPSNGSGFIPKILHQVFTSEMVYRNYKPYINSCLSLNPDWEYYLWTDADAERLITEKHPSFLARYRRYTDGLEKADSIRYIILYHMGGIYLDMDVECVKPFFPALYGVEAFIDQERPEQTSINFLKPYSAMNSAMGSRPGHDFFQHVIRSISKVGWVGDAVRTTGPVVLTAAYESYLRLTGNEPHVVLMEPRVFSPLMTDMKVWKRKCQLPLRSARRRPKSELSVQQKGCLLLKSKQWRSDDRDKFTIAVHRFLHLGYNWIGGAKRRAPFNLTRAFPGRVKFYRNITKP